VHLPDQLHLGDQVPTIPPELIGAILSIILIDLTLSGDNAVVIGMAAHRLPARQRKMAVMLGAGGAIVIRVALTAVAAMLLQIPYLKVAGGILLAWIAFRLLKQEEESAEGVGGSGSFREAIQTIIIADFIMSVDNILGVAAASKGNMGLLLFGLGLSMAIMMVAGSAVATMIDKFWWLVYVGCAVIAWISVEMVLTDRVAGVFFSNLGLVTQHYDEHIDSIVLEPTVSGMIVMAIGTLIILLTAHYFHRHRPNKLRSLEESA
jgi:YjbE family integral membrane protein